MKDVDIFAACLKELLLENDTVTVPGLGSFITRLMPASFSDRGRTINPPYRKLSFRASELGNADVFTDCLAAHLPDGSDPAAWLQSFVKEFKEELEKTKRVDLASLGAMRATAQNDYFFVASDDLDIYPEGLGLEAVTIKSSQLMEEEPVTEPEAEAGQDTEAEPEPKTDPAPAPVAEPAPAPVPEAQPAAQPVQAAAPPADKPRHKLQWWVIVLIVLAAVILFLILSVIFKDILPWGGAVDNFINHLLYSEEELRILNS